MQNETSPEMLPVQPDRQSQRPNVCGKRLFRAFSRAAQIQFVISQAYSHAFSLLLYLRR